MITEYFPGIVGYVNGNTDFKEYIRLIEKDMSNGLYNWTSMLTGSESQSPQLHSSKRRGKNIGLSVCSSMSDSAKKFQLELDKFVSESLQDYSKRYGYWDLSGEGWVLLKYELDDFFITHTDSSRRYPRQVSTVYYVNDDYSGGELSFPYIGITIKPKAGELVIFPSTNLFSHQAEKITDGVKYSLANWFN